MFFRKSRARFKVATNYQIDQYINQTKPKFDVQLPTNYHELVTRFKLRIKHTFMIIIPTYILIGLFFILFILSLPKTHVIHTYYVPFLIIWIILICFFLCVVEYVVYKTLNYFDEATELACEELKKMQVNDYLTKDLSAYPEIVQMAFFKDEPKAWKQHYQHSLRWNMLMYTFGIYDFFAKYDAYYQNKGNQTK